MSKLWMVFGALCVGLLLLAKFVFQPEIVTAPTQTAAQDAQFRKYILDNPEVLMESVQRMQSGATTKALAELRPQIETPFPGTATGNLKGDVTVVEFFDFRCPYCRAAHIELKKLMALDSNIRVVYREMPVLDAPGKEPLSRLASKLALAAAKQGKYVQFHEAIFNYPGRVSREMLVGIVRDLKLNESRIAKDMESDDIRTEIDSNLKLARTLGFDGTPGFMIGEQLFIGAQGVDALRAAVATARAANKN
jgi:protein-disulfide isomerase